MTNNLRLGFFGDGPWSHEALRVITSDKTIEICFVCLRSVNPDQVLKQMAHNLSIPIIENAHINDPTFIERVSSLNVDLLVSMSFDQIIKNPLLSLPTLGFINCHAGALPFYRGRNVINWALINGETRFGITVHYIDSGIDTGDIICQDWVDILPEDDYPSCLTKAYKACPKTLYKAIKQLQKGNAERIVQDSIHPVGTYFPRRVPGDETIDWMWPSLRIHNFVRALTTPGPLARTHVNQQTLGVKKTKLIKDAPSYIATPGEIIGHATEGVVVKTGDSSLMILEVDWVDNESHQKNRPWRPTFKIGTRFSKCEGHSK
ncbi:MAG: methionyl-tRNA formyltransferase [Bdellovibrionales bacterium]|nr:methionyl-tRNA formyltransferase [Bdellovibrionales bacterium]